MSSLIFLFVFFYQTALSGTFILSVSDSADFLVLPIGKQSHQFEVRCDSENVKTVQQWRADSRAQYVVNAGFFDDSMIPVGYTKTQEKTWGSLQNHPAVFAVTSSGPTLFRSDEGASEDSFSSAASGFPILVWNQKNEFTKETKKYARRTIVAEKEEMIYIFISVRGYPSLAESAVALQKFGIKKALNLDGGTSTGFSSEYREIYSVPVPCVILVFKNE